MTPLLLLLPLLPLPCSSCPSPPSPLAASYSLQPGGQGVTYACQGSYRAIGQATSTCRDGEWPQVISSFFLSCEGSIWADKKPKVEQEKFPAEGNLCRTYMGIN